MCVYRFILVSDKSMTQSSLLCSILSIDGKKSLSIQKLRISCLIVIISYIHFVHFSMYLPSDKPGDFVAQQLILATDAFASFAIISPRSDSIYSNTKTNPSPCGNTSKSLTTYGLSRTYKD